MLLAEPDAGADERAVGAAFLSSLRLLASEGPLCLAVDDVQWLDAASLTALRFALQRLEDKPVAVLLACRGAPPAWLARSLPERLRTVAVGGLSVGATRELIDTRLGITFPRPTLLRLWETSAGNPFFALELARALKRRDDTPRPGEPLPLPENLDELLRERLDGLSRTALDVVDVVAAVAEPTADLVEAALPGDSDAGLVEALDARILELDGDRLRFTHPLLGLGCRGAPDAFPKAGAACTAREGRADGRGTRPASRSVGDRAGCGDRRRHRGGGAVRSRTRHAGSLRRARRAGTSAHAARASEPHAPSVPRGRPYDRRRHRSGNRPPRTGADAAPAGAARSRARPARRHAGRPRAVAYREALSEAGATTRSRRPSICASPA